MRASWIDQDDAPALGAEFFARATLNKAGEVIEGDPKQVREVTDVWTFERDTGSRDPNWKLVATQSGR